MPRFQYRAARPGGGEIRGELVADDERAVAAQLQAGGSYPIDIVPVAAALRPARRARNRRLPTRELALLTRQLAALIGAGVTLDRALVLTAAARRHARSAELARSLLAAVNRGNSLSRACSEHPALPRLYPVVIAAGEARGDIPGALERLAAILERNRAIGQSLVNALIYPASVLVVACLSITFLLGFVVPRFETLLTSLRHEPPVAMRILLAVSGLFQSYALPVMIILLAIAAFLLVRRRDTNFQIALGRTLLRVPALGALLVKVETERLCFLLGTLLAGGVAVPTAFATAREATANAALGAGLGAAERGIERGDGVSAALAAIGLLPELALELVRVGEETGDLAPMLMKASDILRSEIEVTAGEWIGLVAPLSMVVLGLLIGAIALAIFGTVLEVYDVAS